MRRMTAPTGQHVDMTPEAHHAWVNRDLAPHLHREAYLHVLRESGVADHHAETLYGLMIDPANWTPYPDTADVLEGLHRQGIKTAVVSNIAFDVRPAFESIGAAGFVDEFVLSFEVGAVKPDAGDLRDRVGPARGGCRARGHGRRQRRGRRRRPRPRLRVRPRRPAADGAAHRRAAQRACRIRRRRLA